MRIITISRQFGSGGRELGKRLADLLGWDYYDKEIISMLAEKEQLDPEYVRSIVNDHHWDTVPLTYRHSFARHELVPDPHIKLMAGQRRIIQQIAEAGNDCIIVGRNADIILRDYGPFRLSVCADIEDRLARCMKHELKKGDDALSEKEVLRNIRRIDKDRRRLRESLTGKDPADSSVFDLTVNAGKWDIRQLALALAEFALRWFAQKEQIPGCSSNE